MAPSSSEQPPRMEPLRTPDNEFFWDAAARGELCLQACADCGVLRHPPRPMCPHCHSVQRESRRLCGRGEVYSWILPRHPAPIGFDQPPIVALITLEEGPRLVSNLSGVALEMIYPGMPVTVTFETSPKGAAVPVFIPQQETGQ